MNKVEGLRTVVGVKSRRVAQHEDALRMRREERRERSGMLDRARHAQAERVREEQSTKEKLVRMFNTPAGFRGAEVLTLQILIGEAVQRSAAAAKEVQTAEKKLEEADEAVQMAAQAVGRAQEQLSLCRKRLEEALDEQARARDDAQDEESEEAAVARVLLQARGQARRRAGQEREDPHG